MEVPLFLVLCGIVCCAAALNCTEEEFQKCLQLEPFEPKPILLQVPLTEAELVKYCRDSVPRIYCLYDFEESCGNEGSNDLYGMVKNLLNLICDTEDPFSQKYLDNVNCLSKVVPDMEKECPTEDIPEDVNRKELCKKITAAFECAKKQVRKKCGKEAENVFIKMYDPVVEHFALRAAKCL